MQPWCGYVIRRLNHDNCKIVRSLKRRKKKKKKKNKKIKKDLHQHAILKLVFCGGQATRGN